MKKYDFKIDSKDAKFFHVSSKNEVSNLSQARKELSDFLDDQSGIQVDRFSEIILDSDCSTGYYKVFTFQDTYVVNGIYFNVQGETERQNETHCKLAREGKLPDKDYKGTMEIWGKGPLKFLEDFKGFN
jgi:hypothetical protein